MRVVSACTEPDSRATGSPHLSRTPGAMLTRAVGLGISCTGPTARVSIAPGVRDKWGLPVARLSGSVHAETTRTARYMYERAHDWLRASGAQRTWGVAPDPGLTGGQHQAGTCRMGTDPANSVTDTTGRVWGHDNLYIADGSVHPTNGGFNPVLTIMAMAFRTADGAARAL